MTTPLTEYEVIVVGGGMAGLGACRRLVEAGIKDILLLEAQDEAGGRIRSVSLDLLSKTDSGSKWLELGAHWMHGEGTHLHEIAKSYDLLSDVTSAEGLGQYLYANGEEIDLSLISEVSDEIGNILEGCECFWTGDDNENLPKSVGHYLTEQFYKYLDSCDDTTETRKIKLDLFDWHIRYQVIDNSCENLNDLSAKSWGRYKFCGGRDYINFKSGYSALVTRLISDLPLGVLKTNKIVTHIYYDSDNCVVSKSPVAIKCGDGSLYHCKHVIVTSSVGHLKRYHRKMFNPELPDKFSTFIESIGFTTINKIFLCYNEPWWTKDDYGFQLIWPTSNDHDIYKSFLSSEQMWLRDLSGFDVLSNMDGVLLGWVGRKGAVDLEKLNEKQIGEHCTLLLRKFTKRNNIPLPDIVIRSQWHKNEFICGGYSHLTTMCDLPPTNTSLCDKIVKKVTVSPEDFSQPIFVKTSKTSQHPAILFAGEATHEKYFSTTHGAFETGERQADKIIYFIQSSKS